MNLLSLLKKIDKLLKKNFLRVEKRLRFVISALLMSSLMLISTFFFFNYAWMFVPFLIVMAYFLTYFSVLEGIEKIEWLTLFLMPVAVTVSFYLFYFLFPVRWITRIPFIFFYGLSIYASLLISNIFNVGVEKSLQLFRAAFSVNYFYHALVSFLFFSIVISLKTNFILNFILIFSISFIQCVQLLWSVRLELKISKTIVYYSLLIALLIAQSMVLFSFIPLKTSVLALFLTTMYYSISGIIYHQIDQKLFKQTIREYIFVIGFVSVIVLLSIQW